MYPTEIFVPEIQYPNRSYQVEVCKFVTWTISPYNENILQVYVKPKAYWPRYQYEDVDGGTGEENTSVVAYITITPTL